jgi:hypothetical protein
MPQSGQSGAAVCYPLDMRIFVENPNGGLPHRLWHIGNHSIAWMRV